MLQATGLELSAGGRELIRALDLALAPGQFWSLLGRNGSGKTSLILALAGLRSRKPARSRSATFRSPSTGAASLPGASPCCSRTSKPISPGACSIT